MGYAIIFCAILLFSVIILNVEAQFFGTGDFGKTICKKDLVLIFKFNGIPACVKPETSVKLVERGWGKIIELDFDQYSPSSHGYLGEIDVSCQIDADCSLNSKSACGPVCGPGNLSVNKKTATMINEWRESLSIPCPIAMCRGDFSETIPICVENVCSSKKVPDCWSICWKLESSDHPTKALEIFENDVKNFDANLEYCDCTNYLIQARDYGIVNQTTGINYCNSLVKNPPSGGFKLTQCLATVLDYSFEHNRECVRQAPNTATNYYDKIGIWCDLTMEYPDLCESITDSKLRNTCKAGYERSKIGPICELNGISYPMEECDKWRK